MAPTNRDRIGTMFDLMSPALDAFIQRIVGPQLAPGADWSHLVAVKDRRTELDRYSRADPLMQLRMLSEDVTSRFKEGWRPFREHLSRSHERYAGELREVRNSWAHGQAFTADDTYRALDSAERLIRTVGAVDAADRLGVMRNDVRRAVAEQEERKTRAAAVSIDSAGLPSWRDVLPPHHDVATGNFQSAQFAADLYKVSHGTADVEQDYADPAEFFARTYLTEGLRDLLGRAVARLIGDPNATPVINLQTNFGGGKTHSMLALWHLAAGRPLASYPQAIQEVLTSHGHPAATELDVRRAALVGNHLAPTGTVKDDGTKVNTLWGELAWQLGGRTAYEIVADADRASTHSGPELHRLLAAYAPAVILIDEWVAYARQLYGRDGDRLAGGTFDTQFTFAQSLTEAAKTTPGVLVAISIPASYSDEDKDVAASAEEVGGEHGREALRRLQNVVRRVAEHWHPASNDEAYEIVRRRLFVEPDAAALIKIGRTARAFHDYYVKHAADFPRETRELAYEERIRRCFPIHPELFDRLYEDWSTLDRFQRTRGVLRLMNHIIHALWSADPPDGGPLIMPGSIPLTSFGVGTELVQYLPDAWRPIIDADVDGPSSVPVAIDREKPTFGQRSLTRRLARTVFFGAAPTVGSSHKGLETARVFVGTAIPGDVPGNFHSALNQLADRATYFYASSSRYWYDLQANITRRAKDVAERLPEDDVWAEVVRRLEAHRRTRAGFAAVSVAPEDSAEVPDLDEARLVLLHPRLAHTRRTSAEESAAVAFAREATDRRGSAQRVNRNMPVFLAGDADRLSEVDVAVRQFLAWSSVATGESDLTGQQVTQARERRDQADQVVTDRLVGAYHWVLIPEAKDAAAQFSVAVVKAEGAATSLPDRVTRKLHNTGQLADVHTAALIRLDLDGVLAARWADHISAGELWSLYAMYPYLRRLRDREVLSAAVRTSAEVMYWQTQGFAIATGYDPVTETYTGLQLPTDSLPIPSVPDSLLIVRPERAEAQRERERSTANPVGPGPIVDPAPGPGPGPSPPPPPSKRRFFGTRKLAAERYAADFKKINDEVLAHLASVPGVRLTVSIEIEAEVDDGFADDKVRTVDENARTLKFDQHGFEEV